MCPVCMRQVAQPCIWFRTVPTGASGLNLHQGRTTLCRPRGPVPPPRTCSIQFSSNVCKQHFGNSGFRFERREN
jgi:hypothetical protein